jgi:hypothetical protein
MRNLANAVKQSLSDLRHASCEGGKCPIPYQIHTRRRLRRWALQIPAVVHAFSQVPIASRCGAMKFFLPRMKNVVWLHHQMICSGMPEMLALASRNQPARNSRNS